MSTNSKKGLFVFFLLLVVLPLLVGLACSGGGGGTVIDTADDSVSIIQDMRNAARDFGNDADNLGHQVLDPVNEAACEVGVNGAQFCP